MALKFLARHGQGKRVMALGLAAVLGFGLATIGSAQAEQNTIFFASKKSKTQTAQKPNWHNSAPIGKAVSATAIINDGSVSPFLAASSASALEQAITRYQSIQAQGGWPQVSSIGGLKKGSTGKSVATLNTRLFKEGYLRAEGTQGEFAAKFTSATEDAVKRFQRNHGLAASGVADAATLKELNVPVGQRLATMRANLPRLQQYEQNLGDRYVTVNVPAMQIEAVQGVKVYSRHNAIVGRPSRPTPVVQTALATVKFNPYWNAPASIIEKDIIPRMISGGPSKILRDMNITVFKGVGGPEVDPDSVDWRNAIADDYHFRQEPGGDNAMATAKIEFNSPFGIYLHDTPEPQLFGGGMRFLSSGCVRVDKVAILINWILQGQDGINQGRIAELAQTKERLDVQIANPPQLRVVYLTAWPNANGEVQFRNDVYKLDGSGFVVGQPLDTEMTGERFVLKPIARTASAVDADEATGFSLFKFTPSKGVNAADKTAQKQAVTAKKVASNGKAAAATASKPSLFGNWQNGKQGAGATKSGKTAQSGNKPRSTLFMSSADAAKYKKDQAKKDAAAKKAGVKSKTVPDKAKLDKAKPDKAKLDKAKPDKAKLDKAKPDKAKLDKVVPNKGKASATTVASDKPKDAKAAASTTKADPKAVTKDVTSAKATNAKLDCKPDKDGKLPTGCKAPASATPKKKLPPDGATASAN
jgi:murein L,D-transpeptidase YcbB/YkuD